MAYQASLLIQQGGRFLEKDGIFLEVDLLPDIVYDEYRGPFVSKNFLSRDHGPAWRRKNILR